MSIQVGDYIKSYHFQPFSDRPDRYMVGQVTEVTSHSITFMAFYDVVEAKNGDIIEAEQWMDKVTTAKPGSMLIGEYEGRVTVFTDEGYEAFIPEVLRQARG